MSEDITKVNFRDACIFKIIHVSVREGTGIKNDPYRLVFYYLDFDGNLLFKKDSNE